MILGRHFSAHITQQNREEGRWDSALQRALCAALTEPCEESYKALKELLVPFLANSEALATLVHLADRWDPEGRVRIRGLIKKWVESAQQLEPEEEAKCRGPQVVSRTLADLFYRQGHMDEAKRIYRSLLKRNPQDEDILIEYQKRFRGGDGSYVEDQLLRSLEEMVKRIRMAKMDGKTREGQLAANQKSPDP